MPLGHRMPSPSVWVWPYPYGGAAGTYHYVHYTWAVTERRACMHEPYVVSTTIPLDRAGLPTDDEY